MFMSPQQQHPYRMPEKYCRLRENRDNCEIDFSENHLHRHYYTWKNNCQTQTKRNHKDDTNRIDRTANHNSSCTNQTTSDRSEDTAEICVSRVDPNICIQEEQTHNIEPPTMGTSTQLEASLEMITEGLVATLEKTTNTVESEEDTTLFRQRLQRVLGV